MKKCTQCGCGDGVHMADCPGNAQRARENKVQIIAHEVVLETLRALRKYQAFHSAHEGYAVILEELDELKQEIWKKAEARDLKKMEREAIQVAAMAVRFVVDLLATRYSPLATRAPEVPR